MGPFGFEGLRVSPANLFRVPSLGELGIGYWLWLSASGAAVVAAWQLWAAERVVKLAVAEGRKGSAMGDEQSS